MPTKTSTNIPANLDALTAIELRKLLHELSLSHPRFHEVEAAWRLRDPMVIRRIAENSKRRR
jgi:hypothetical protein